MLATTNLQLWIELLVFELFIHDNDTVISTLQIVENVE